MKHYHFIGIGGIGMGTLASLLQEKGHKISGSDLKDNLLTSRLRAKGAEITIGHKKENVQRPDCIVFSSAINADNPELQQARAKGISIVHRAKLLAEVMAEKRLIAVAGAHGKTTTTSMVSCVLRDAGLQPTLAVGGIMNNGDMSADLGQGEYCVAEVDESDGSFLHFHPFYSIVTNIDFEHMEYYKTWDNMMGAYAQFLGQTHPQGSLIVCGDDVNLRKLIQQKKIPNITYGLSAGNDLMAEDICFDQGDARFLCYERGVCLGAIELRVLGRHNIANALAVVALSRLINLDFALVQKSLKDFSGVQRRFTRRGEINDILFIDDYAHHPTEVQATLAAARLLRRKRVIAIFQPHRFSRLKFLQKEFIASLQNCDYLVLTDVYAASEEPIVGVGAPVLYQQLKDREGRPVVYLHYDQIADHVRAVAQPGDLVITLGAGNINQIIKDIMAGMER